jgi:hypothetical protein
MPSFIRQGASVTASILETAAGVLRKLAETEDASPKTEQRAEAREPAKTREPAPSRKPEPAATPPAGTRTRISNPKAARKVRARQG